MAKLQARRVEDPQRLKPEMASMRLLVLGFVRDYARQWGESPSQREIAAAFGISRVRVRELLRALVKAGQLLRTPGPRGLVLPDLRDEAVRHLRELGWTVDEEFGLARVPRPHSTLMALPPLTYRQVVMADDRETGDGDGDT